MAKTQTYPNIQDLIAAQQFLQGQQQYNYGGGGWGAFQEAQKQKAQQQAAQQLQNFFATNQQYGGAMAPPRSVQQAAGTLFSTPQQQTQQQYGMPMNQPGILPQGPQNIAEAQSKVNMMKYLQGQGVPEDYATAASLGISMPRVGQLSYSQYQQFNNDLSNVDNDIQLIKSQALSSGKKMTDDEAKIELYRVLVGQYGANEEAKIKQALWPMGTSALQNQMLMQAFQSIQQQNQK
jgi:hypothetical protein